MKFILFVLCCPTLLLAQGSDSTSTALLRPNTLDSVAVMLFEQYNLDSQKMVALYGDLIKRDTTLVGYKPDSTRVTYHYVIFDSTLVRLYEFPFEGSRFLDAIYLAGKERFRLFGLDGVTPIDQYKLSDSDESYSLEGYSDGRSIVCIQRLNIEGFPYRVEFEFHIKEQQLILVIVVYTNPSEWWDYNKK